MHLPLPSTGSSSMQNVGNFRQLAFYLQRLLLPSKVRRVPKRFFVFWTIFDALPPFALPRNWPSRSEPSYSYLPSSLSSSICARGSPLERGCRPTPLLHCDSTATPTCKKEKSNVIIERQSHTRNSFTCYFKIFSLVALLQNVENKIMDHLKSTWGTEVF